MAVKDFIRDFSKRRKDSQKFVNQIFRQKQLILTQINEIVPNLSFFSISNDERTCSIDYFRLTMNNLKKKKSVNYLEN